MDLIGLGRTYAYSRSLTSARHGMADAWCADVAPPLIFAQEPIRIVCHHAAASWGTLVLIIAVLATAGGLDVTWAAVDGASRRRRRRQAPWDESSATAAERHMGAPHHTRDWRGR
jgi:hypothetical protein